MTQGDFGDKIGLSQSSLTMIESNRRVVTDRMIKTIVMAYDVSEEWLTDGNGEMFKEDTESEIAAFAGTICADPDKLPAITKFLEKLARMNEDELKSVDTFLEMLMNK